MVTEKRLIDANALMEEINAQRRASMGSFPRRYYVVGDALNSIRNAPTVDAVEVVRGRWEKDGTCSNCKGLNPTYRANKWYTQFPDFPGNFYQLNYCPNCGAKMDLEV